MFRSLVRHGQRGLGGLLGAVVRGSSGRMALHCM